MDIKEIGAWKETWDEELYKRDYENLPDFMMDCLWEYFGSTGTAVEFNSHYQFGSNDMDIRTVVSMVEQEYKEFVEGEGEPTNETIDIIVVTNPELGWDCVVGCYRAGEETDEWPEEDGYIHHNETLY